MSSPKAETQTERRSFFKQSLAILLGAVAGLVPVAAGLAVVTDPLRRKPVAGAEVQVTTLEALPENGVPRRFPVIAGKTDAWNRFQAAPIGAVFLRRTGGDQVEALNVICPHAGCAVDFVAGRGYLPVSLPQKQFQTGWQPCGPA